MVHLAHRVPWYALSKSIIFIENPHNGKIHVHQDEAVRKVVAHFARCLFEAIRDFEATDQRSFEESFKYDIRRWKDENGHLTFELDLRFAEMRPELSVLYGYIELNLLLLDWSKYSYYIEKTNGSFKVIRRSWVMDYCLGYGYAPHPEWLQQRLLALWENGHPEPTSHVFKELHEHVKDLFRVMYTSGSDIFNPSFLESLVLQYFNFGFSLDFQEINDNHRFYQN